MNGTVQLTEDERYMNYSTGALSTGKQVKENLSLGTTEPVCRNVDGRCFLTIPLRNGGEITYVRTR